MEPSPTRPVAAPPNTMRRMTNLRVALTGMTGFIGRATAASLRASGHHVQGLVRPGREAAADDLGAHIVTGTMEDPASHVQLLDGADVLVHNAVDWQALKAGDLRRHLDVNLVAGVALLDAAATAGCRIVLISTVAVHHHMLKQWDGRIDHMHPSRPSSPYGALKAALEAHCWALHTQSETPVSVLRPSAVYGMDPKANRSVGWTMIEHLLAGQPFPRPGGGKFVHVDDVAASIRAAATSTTTDLRIHHLVDCYARWSDWTAMAVRELGLPQTVQHRAPPQPQNMFDTDDVERDLGVSLNRGHAGIGEHIRHLIHAQRGSP